MSCGHYVTNRSINLTVPRKSLSVAVGLILLLFAPAKAQIGWEMFLVDSPLDELNDTEPINVQWNMSGQLQLFLNEGINYINEGHAGTAVVHLTEGIELDSTVWALYYYRGVAYKMLHQPFEAQYDFEKSLALGQVPEPALELGKIFQLQNKRSEAEKYFDKAIELAPGRAKGFYLKGNLLLAKRDYINAGRMYEESQKRDEAFLNPTVKLALLEIQRRDKKAGEALLGKVLATDSVHQMGLLFSGLYYYDNAKEKSLQNWNTLIRTDPMNLLYRFFRGILHTDMGDYNRAFSDFQKIIQDTNESEDSFIGKQTWVDKKLDIQHAGYYAISNMYALREQDVLKIKKAYCLFVIADFKGGIETVQSIRKFEKSALCLFMIGLGYEHSRMHEEAFRYYDRALQIDDDILDAHKKRGIYHSNYKNWRAAEADFDRGLRINPRSTPLYKLRGVTRFYNKDYRGAIEDFTTYLRKDSTDVEARYSRAFSCQKIDEHEMAINDFIRADYELLRFEDVESSIHYLAEEGDTAKCLGYLNSLIETYDWTDASLYRIKLLLKHGAWGEAQTLTDQFISANKSLLAYQQSGLLLIQGLLSQQTHDHQTAEDFFTSAIRVDGSNAEAYFERGKLYLVQKRVDEAKTDLKTSADMGQKRAREILKKI